MNRSRERFGYATEEWGGYWAAVDAQTGEKLMCGLDCAMCGLDCANDARRFLEARGFLFVPAPLGTAIFLDARRDS
jgi:hypothetical protein